MINPIAHKESDYPTEKRSHDWVRDAVFYQIFPDRFAASARIEKPGTLEPWEDPPSRQGFKGGDLLGIAEHLDDLEDLGVNALYLNPIFQSACNHRYHTYDYLSVDPLLGGNAAFRELLDAAHDRDMRVIIDGVFHHTGRGFWAFHHLLEAGASSPYRDWYTVDSWPLNAYKKSGRPNYAAWWGLRPLPKLNVQHPPVREYLLGVAEHWTAFGVDGWRLDVPADIDDETFWPEFCRRVRALRSDAYLVGEIWDVAPEWTQRDRFDGLMNYPFARCALGFCARRIAKGTRVGGRRMSKLSAKSVTTQLASQYAAYDFETNSSQLNLLGSHDTPRFLTQAGGDLDSLHLATLLQMCMPGAPCIYYGDEIGLEGGPDPDCRRSFIWDRDRWHRPTREFFQRAIKLRKACSSLRDGDLVFLPPRDGVLSFCRRNAKETSLVVINSSDENRRVRLPTHELPPGLPVETWLREAPAPRRTSTYCELSVPGRSGRVLLWSDMASCSVAITSPHTTKRVRRP